MILVNGRSEYRASFRLVRLDKSKGRTRNQANVYNHVHVSFVAGRRPAHLAALPSCAAAVVRGQRVRRLDLRNRLVPVAATGDRFVGGFAGRVAGNLHGRDVSGQSGLAAHHLRAASSLARLRLARSWDRASSGSWFCLACHTSADFTSRAPGMDFRESFCAGWCRAVCLLPPTLLMGATLPAMARWIETTPKGVSWLGFFYGGNIAGAVFGCLLAGFYLLRVYDMATATYVAAAINGAVALIGLGLAAVTPQWTVDGGLTQTRSERPTGVLAGVRRDRAVRAVRAGRRGDLDAPVVADAGRDGLHLLHHPGRVPGGLGDRQQRRGVSRARNRAAAGRAGLVPDVPGRGDCLDRVHARQLAPLLADQPVAFHESLVYLPTRSGALSLGLLPAACLWGASFPLALAAVASPGRTRDDWWRASMPPTRSARSWAPSRSAWS